MAARAFEVLRQGNPAPIGFLITVYSYLLFTDLGSATNCCSCSFFKHIATCLAANNILRNCFLKKNFFDWTSLGEVPFSFKRLIRSSVRCTRFQYIKSQIDFQSYTKKDIRPVII